MGLEFLPSYPSNNGPGGKYCEREFDRRIIFSGVRSLPNIPLTPLVPNRILLF
jgi:hypothetical protein